MSDGHFNRSLLPSTPYHSGLQTGRTQMRLKAQEALKKVLSEHFPDLSTDQQDKILSEFQNNLR